MAEQRRSGLPPRAWVVVADGEKALFLVNRGDAEDMNLVVEKVSQQDNPKAQDWAENRPGRFNDGPSVHRSAVQDTDWHVLEKERFASDLADRLYDAAHRGRFDKLVVIASRPVLSQLRQELHSEVQDRLLFDVPAVLTNHPLDQIEKHLARHLEEASLQRH